MGAILNIQVSRDGVDKIFADTESISDTREVSELIRATDIGSRLLHDSVVEFFAGEPPIAEEPEVFLPAFVDGLQDCPRKVKIRVANGPRDHFDCPPSWFVQAIKEDNAEYFSTVEPDLQGEMAVSLVGSNKWLDHWGWCELYDGNGDFVEDVLVTEPYALTSNDVEQIASLSARHSWTFRILGESSYYPSATLRVEIRPRVS